MAEAHHQIGTPFSQADGDGELVTHSFHFDGLIDECGSYVEGSSLQQETFAGPPDIDPAGKVCTIRGKHDHPG